MGIVNSKLRSIILAMQIPDYKIHVDRVMIIIKIEEKKLFIYFLRALIVLKRIGDRQW